MQYELRTQVIEAKRQTYDHIAERFGDKPATRYQEGSVAIQPRENFHYRPMWAPDQELYGDGYSVLVLSDPDAYLDPRQYYYAPYVSARAQSYEEFGTTLDYVDDKELLTSRLDQGWRDVLATVVVPLRHYESGTQLIFSNAARFSNGSALAQCLAYGSFDRTGNAQVLSRIGLTLGGGQADLLATAKTGWLEDPALQPLRELLERTICIEDWGIGVVTIDVVDRLLYGTFVLHLEDFAVTGGAPAYSLATQHLTAWYGEHRKWLDALYTAWREDPQTGAANAEILERTTAEAVEKALSALRPLAEKVDGLVGAGAVTALEATAEQVRSASTAPADA